MLLGEADQVQQLEDALLARLALVDLVDVQPLADDVGDGHAGVQGGVGVLEDHLDVLGELLALLALQVRHVLALKEDLAVRGLVQADDGAAERGLSAAGLADQAEGLALFDGEGDVVHGAQQLFMADGEVFF